MNKTGTVNFEIIDSKRKTIYYFLWVLIFIFLVLSMIIDEGVFSWIFISLTFVSVLATHFYHGKRIIGNITFFNAEIRITDLRKQKAVNISLSDIAKIRLLYTRTADSYSIVSGTGGMNNYLTINKKSGDNRELRVFIKSDKELLSLKRQFKTYHNYNTKVIFKSTTVFKHWLESGNGNASKKW